MEVAVTVVNLDDDSLAMVFIIVSQFRIAFLRPR